MTVPWILLCLAAPALAGTDIRSADGAVQVFLPALGDWRQVSKVPFGLRPGDRVRLKPLSKAKLVFEDGSTVRASDDAAFTLEHDDERGASIVLEKGRLEASVERFHDRLFEVRTPNGKVTLRNDRVSISVDARRVVVVEVTSGLAQVEPAVGPPVQIPDDHRLELPPGKAPGLPVGLKEFRDLQRRGKPAAPGMNRKFERPRQESSPAIGVAPPSGGKPKPRPELGAGSLGLPEPKQAAPPKLGLESIGMEPALGLEPLGIKEPKPHKTEPELGHKSLGLKDPGPEPKPKPAEARPVRVKKERPPEEPRLPGKVSTDISPLVDFRDFGVAAPPKPKKPAKAVKPPRRPPPAAKPKARPRDEPTADLSPSLDLLQAR